MKTLSKGRVQKDWAIESKCTADKFGGGGCGSKLLVEQGDVYQRSAGEPLLFSKREKFGRKAS